MNTETNPVHSDPTAWHRDAFQSFLQKSSPVEQIGDENSAANGCGRFSQEESSCKGDIRSTTTSEAVNENNVNLSEQERREEIKYFTSEEETSVETRQVCKLIFDPKVSQQKRRELALSWQKSRRDELLDKIRQLDGESTFSDSEPEDEENFVKVFQKNRRQKNGPLAEVLMEEVEGVDNEEAMETASVTSSIRKGSNKRRKHLKKKGKGHPPCRLMLSEWLDDKPDDFEENWMGVLCPVGKRCLVVAARGKTTVYSRRNEYMGTYKSLLPGGRKYSYKDSSTPRSNGVTVLDCFWSEENATFYVLDLICWNSHSCSNCDTEYRQFFLTSKFSENPELMKTNNLNPFAFVPLPYFSCNTISEVMNSEMSLPIFPQKVDGLLLFHKQAFYIGRTNPLCLWIYLTDVESKLSIPISPELLDRQILQKKREESDEQPRSLDLELEMDG